MNAIPNWPLESTLPVINQLYIISQFRWLQSHLHSTATSCSDMDIYFVSWPSLHSA